MPAMSASDSAAAMTMAPSVGWGTYCISAVAKTRTTAITAAPTTPVTWDREPACSATAVRDPLVLTGKPWKSPAAMLAAPMPIISWLPWTRSPRRAAKAEAVDIVSASATTAMARAPRKSGGTSPQPTVRDRERREALREHADRVDAVGLEVEHVDRDGGEDDDDQDARDLGQEPVQQQDAGQRR